ncbi:MAG: phosphate/phosphite/phosphonate ABC transporter substrate-binding protein [Caldilineales bacterium]|nr:phosphate/phosphite/phosphonate ABC transporter substrate-binding protein [Caldilineales bacterium]
MRKQKWLILVAVVGLLALLVSACAVPAPAPAAPAEQPAAPTEAPAEEPAASTLGTADDPIVMSFVPSGDTQEIIASGDDLAKMISDKTGLVIDANVGTDFAAVREAMGANQAQIGWLNTFNYLLAHEKYGIDIALATERFGSTFYRGQLNVAADAGIESLEDLKGKRVCWGDPNSTSSYVIPHIYLQANGIDPENDFSEAISAGSHNNIITQIYQGNCDFGFTYEDARGTIEDDFPDVKEKIAVLDYTTEIPNDNVSFTKDFPPEMRAAIVAALVEIAQSEEGKTALDQLYEITGLQESTDSFYDAFRADLSKAGIDIEALAK